MTTLYLIDLCCFSCGSPMGAVITASTRDPIKTLPCARCGGAPVRTGEVEQLRRQERVDRREYDSRRGRPPTWLVEERRAAFA